MKLTIPKKTIIEWLKERQGHYGKVVLDTKELIDEELEDLGATELAKILSTERGNYGQRLSAAEVSLRTDDDARIKQLCTRHDQARHALQSTSDKLKLFTAATDITFESDYRELLELAQTQSLE